MINNDITIHTTIDKGKTHIAADENYIGSVGSYNYFFTRLFARLFNIATKIDFDGTCHWVNKKDYIKLLSELTSSDVKLCELRDYNLFKNKVPANYTSRNRMRHFISKGKSRELFRKLAYEIRKGHYGTAKKLIGKGADLDRYYVERYDLDHNKLINKIAFKKILDGLSKNYAWDLDVFKGTPLHHLAAKQDSEEKIKLYDYFVQFGAKENLNCKTFRYKGESKGFRYRQSMDGRNIYIKHIVHYSNMDSQDFKLHNYNLTNV